MSNKVEVKVGGKVYLMNQVTYSKTERTIFDWDSSYIEEFMRSGDVEMRFSESMDSSDVRMRVNEFGQIVQAPLPPEKPDRSKWKRMTPKRVEILAEYRMAKAKYDKEMEEWLKLPFLDEGRTREEFIHDQIVFLRNKPSIDYGINKESYYAYLNGTFTYEIPTFAFPCGKWDKRLGTNLRVEMPEWAVEHHKMEIVYHEDPTDLGMWLDDLIDPVWRREEYERERTEYRQSRSKFRKAIDTTVQLDLFSNNYRDITKDVLHTFETDPNKELAMKYVLALVDKYRPCIHGTVNIPSIYILLNASERDEIDRRAEMVRG